MAVPFHKHDTNGGLLCWSHGASPRVVDTFVNFNQDGPLLNIIFFFWILVLIYQTARCHGRLGMRSVPLGSHMSFIFMVICQTSLFPWTSHV